MIGAEVVGANDTPVDPATAARAIGLALGGGTPPADGTPLADHDAAELLNLCEHHRLLGALVEAVENGAVVLTDEQRARVAQRHRFWLLNVMKVERLCANVADSLGAADIDMVVVKGLALAHTVYGDPGWRVFADLDLLVPEAQFDAAIERAITDLGAQRPTAELRPGFDREFGKEAMLEVDGMELDVHRTLVAGPFGLTIDLDELFADRTAVDIGGRSVHVLGPAARYLHACYNVALGDFPVRLGSVHDLVVLDRRGDVDLDAVIDTAARWGGTAVLQRAGALLSRLYDTLHGTPHGVPDPSPTWARLARLEVPRREWLAMRTYLTPARGYRRQLASLLVIRGLRPKARYMRALVRPSGAYLRSRGWTTGYHVRRAARRLTRGTDG